MSKRIHILNCPIDALTMEETLEQINDAIISRNHIQHVVVNAAKIVMMQKDKNLAEAIEGSDIINVDGQAVVWASKLLKQPLPERVAGIDLMSKLVEMSHKKGYRIFFLGARQDVIQKVIAKYRAQYGDSIIAGYKDGYFSKSEEHAVVEEISKSNADILFVAIPSPQKELFLNQYSQHLGVPFIMGVGGSFDVISGQIKRAPLWMQKYGMEWFFRLIQEPRKMWKRYLFTNISFILLLLRHMIKKGTM